MQVATSTLSVPGERKGVSEGPLGPGLCQCQTFDGHTEASWLSRDICNTHVTDIRTPRKVTLSHQSISRDRPHENKLWAVSQ